MRMFSAPGTHPGKNITLTLAVAALKARHVVLGGGLMISDDRRHHRLPADAPLGKSYVEWAGVSDP